MGGSLSCKSTPCQICGYRHCGSEDMFLVVEGKDSTCPGLHPPLLFISKVLNMKMYMAMYINRFDSGHTLPG